MSSSLSVILNTSDHVMKEPGWADEGILKSEIGRYDLTDCWPDPVTGTVMALPLQMTEDYQTSAEGDLARLRLSDFGNPADWAEISYRFPDDWFLTAKGVGKTAVTSTLYGNNQAFWVAFYVPGKSGWNGIACEIQFGKARETENPLLARIYSNGQIDLLENNSRKWSGFITGKAKSIVGQMVTLMILPYRRNSILFWSNQGGSALYEDPEITDISDSSHPVVTGSAVTVKFPETRGFFQLMPLKYKSDFTLSLKKPVKLPYAPTVLPDTSDFEWDIPSGTGASVGLLLPDGTAAVYDGSHQEYKWQILGAGTADKTPFIYRSPVRFPPVSAERTGTPENAEADLLRARRIVTADPTRRFFQFTLRNPENHAGLQNALNRSLIVKTGPYEIFRGLTLSPKRDETRLSLLVEAQDLWKRLDHTVLADSRAYDGLTFAEAVRDILGYAGFLVTDANGNAAYSTEEIELDTGFALTFPRAPRSQSPCIQAEDGETVGEFLLRLRRGFFPDWVMEFRPVQTEEGTRIKFVLKPPEENKTSLAIFYQSTEEARQAGSTLIASNLSWTRGEPAANQVQVRGEDPLGQPVFTQISDSAGMDPSLPEADRPLSWVGETWQVIRKDSRLASQEEADRLCGLLFSKLSSSRCLVRWTGPLAEFLWPGDCVTLDGLGDFEIDSMDTRFVTESETDSIRPTVYTARSC